jgi:pSer/pThr/pTyr-binding forkhead associated (FHA) protein
MAKLTVYFKNKVVCSYSISFEVGKVHIGRDENNDLVIDSPEFAAIHAVVMVRSNSTKIRQLNAGFPLIINGKNIKEAILNDGDTITVGQHIIFYSANQTTSNAEKTINSPVLPADRKTKESYLPHVANYQVISGTNIGKIFHLKIPMTMIGEPSNGIVVISKRKDGFYASILENTDIITINDQPLADQMVKLDHNDVLAVGDTTVQFYLR